MGIKETEKKFTASTCRRAEIVAFKGRGAVLTDILGDRFVDFGGGGAACALGFGNKKWTKAVIKQVKRAPFAGNAYFSRPVAEFAKQLCRRAKMKEAFFASSADAANECAILAARKYSADKYGAGRHSVAVLENSFHGYSLAALSAAGALAEGCGPAAEGFISLPANDAEALSAALDGSVCAVMIETVQRKTLAALEREYLEKLAELCKKKDVLLIADETFTGGGRTGQLFAYMNYGLAPDVVTASAGFGGPLGAALFGEKTAGTLACGVYGAQGGGDPAVCAGALAVLNALNEKMAETVRTYGRRMREVLAECDKVKRFGGLGMLVGLEVDNAPAVQRECFDRGLLVRTEGEHIVVLTPPLNIDEETLENGLNALKNALG